MGERKLLLQLLAFIFGPAIDVLHLYFETVVLHQMTFEDFLNDNKNKHILFHEYIPTIPCCECIKTVSIAATSKRKSLNKSQFRQLYDESGPITPNHQTNLKNVVLQHCLCKVSARQVTPDDLDIPLTCSVLDQCCPNIFGHYTWLSDIRNSRNSLTHNNDGEISDIEFKAEWQKLENAVLGIAGQIGSACEKQYRRQIRQLNNKSVEELQSIIEETKDNISELRHILNEVMPLTIAMQEKREVIETVSTVQQAHEEDLRDIRSTLVIESEKLHNRLYDKRDDFNFPTDNIPFIDNNIPAAPAYDNILAVLYGKHGNMQIISELRKHTERPDQEGAMNECNSGTDSRRCTVLITIQTPASWNRQRIAEKLSAILLREEQPTENDKFLHLVGFRFQSLILETWASHKLIRDRSALLMAISVFLEKIFWEIDTSIPDHIFIVIDVFSQLKEDTMLDAVLYGKYGNVQTISDIKYHTLISGSMEAEIEGHSEYLSKDLEDIKIVEGCDARFELWTKDVGVNVKWFKGDIEIEMSDKYVVQTSCQMHCLVVTKADLTDRGSYTAKFLGYARSARLDIEESFNQLFFVCDGIFVDCITEIKLQQEYTNFCRQYKTESVTSHSVSYYLDALIKDRDTEMESLLVFSKCPQKKIVRAVEWLSHAAEVKKSNLCRLLLAYIQDETYNMEKDIVPVLKLAMAKEDKETSKALSWFITKTFFHTYDMNCKNIVDIWPAVRCADNANCNNKTFCSDDFVIVVELIQMVKDLTPQVFGINIEYLSEDVKDMGARFKDPSFNVDHAFNYSVKSNNAKDLFTLHSKLTIIGKSFFSIQGRRDNGEMSFTMEPCIQLFCRTKGLIPFGETHFPVTIENFKTDVLSGIPRWMTNLRVGDQIESQNSAGTLGGFVKVRGDVAFLTCAHVVLSKTILSQNLLYIPDDVAVDIHCLQPTHPSNQQRFVCGKIRDFAFQTDNPSLTSIDAALVKIKKGINIEGDDFVANHNGDQHQMNLLGLKSIFLNDNCLDHKKLFYGQYKFQTVTVGCVSGVNVCESVCMEKDPEVPEYVEFEPITKTYEDIVKSEVSNSMSTVVSVLATDIHTQEIRLKMVDDKRQVERISRRMYKQIHISNIPFQQGDSGTCIYVCDNRHQLFGCIGMAVSLHPTSGCIATPMKEILKHFQIHFKQ